MSSYTNDKVPSRLIILLGYLTEYNKIETLERELRRMAKSSSVKITKAEIDIYEMLYEITSKRRAEEGKKLDERIKDLYDNFNSDNQNVNVIKK
jgi:hypothetical protein